MANNSGPEVKMLAVRNKVTKNTVRFGEQGVMVDGKEAHIEVIPQIYVTKTALTRLFNAEPESVKAISVTISVVADSDSE